MSPPPEPVQGDLDEREDLLPCPFCGGTATIFAVEETDNKGGYVAGCGDCEASTRVWFPVKDSVTRIITEAWNRRPTSHELLRVTTALEAMTQERDDWRLSFESANEALGKMERDLAASRKDKQ